MIDSTNRALPHTTPEQQGIASAAILQFVEALESGTHEAHSFMLLRHGSVIAEGWWSPYRPDDVHALFSVSKSFTSTAVGLAVSEGRLSIDDPVLAFFPDAIPGEVSDHLAAMRVRHLLTMSTGHTEDTWTYMLDRPDGNWIRAFFETPLRHAPGTHFLYNTGATYMLSAIMQKATGMKLIDYLQPRLFAALGIERALWQESPQGISIGGYGLSAQTEAVARLGQLYLQKGMWEGHPLLPEAWITAATSAQIPNGNAAAESDETQGYGYQFWRGRHNTYRASGAFGQYCIVMPDQDAVIAFTSGIDVFDQQQLAETIWDVLLPAMRPAALPDDPAMAAVLSEKLAGLSLPIVQGRASSPLSASLTARTYRFDANPLHVESLAFSADSSGWKVTISTAQGEESFPCGYGEWQRGETTLFNHPHWFPHDQGRMAASGAWTAEDRLTMIIRLYETPFVHTLVFDFVEDELLLEVKVNATLESPKPILLTGRVARP